MSTITNISQAKASLSPLVARASRGERIIIGKAGRPVAMLVPWEQDETPRTLTGPWAGRMAIADDFDELPAQLADAFGVPRAGAGLEPGLEC